MYFYKKHIPFSEVDGDLRITLFSILTEFQDCSIFHSASLGMGVRELYEEGHIWLLSSWQVVIDHRPCLDEEVTVGTWAYDWKGFYGYRNFILSDAAGEIAVRANSTWFYLDIKSGCPTKIPLEVRDAYRAEPMLDMDIADRKIHLPQDAAAADPIPVRKSYIDANGHVNNARYVLIAQEFLPDRFVTKQIRAEYRKAAKYGDVLFPSVSTGDGIVTVALDNENGRPFAIVEFTGETASTQN